MEDLSLHVLDIAENAVTAGARRVDIRVTEDEEQDLLTIEVEDDGKGMDERTLKKSTDPFFTMRTGAKVGLGLPLLLQSARECNGRLEVSSQPGQRTLVRATFRNSHIDRKPLGDMTQTLCALVSGHPEVRFTYAYRKGKTQVFFDTDAAQGKIDFHNDIDRGPDSEKVEP